VHILRDWQEQIVFYKALKDFAGFCFNVLNLILGGNLPPFGCVCIIVEREQRFLVIQRPGGRIVFPGGFMRWHEHPEQTLIREGQEETGLLLHPRRILGYYPIISQRMTRMSTLNIVYLAEVEGGELRESIEGQPDWLTEEQLQEKLTWFYRDVFQDYLRDRAKN
jgi:ADP-ribose pyrophosphatase YjhB (NUDIX family)